MQKAVRIVALVAVFGLILVAIITSTVKPVKIEENIWTEAMTLGDVETANRHYVVYTDLMCPYCNYYAHTIWENDGDFQQFLADHHILYEVRMTDMLYEGSGVEFSRPAAVAAYCAARENKFWDYYHLALDSLFTDYYEKGYGNSKTAPKIPDMTLDYWLEIGKEVGLGDEFAACYKNQETLSEVKNNTYRASDKVSGLPYFYFDKYITGGFDPGWSWAEVSALLKAGL